jgi:hypothetical protein
MWLDTENPRPELYARGIPTIVFVYFATCQIIRRARHASLQSKENEMQLSLTFPINWLYSNFKEAFVLAARSNCMKWSDKHRLFLSRH